MIQDCYLFLTCLLNFEVALAWVWYTKGCATLEDSSFWMGLTVPFPCIASFMLTVSLSSKVLESITSVLLLTKLRGFSFFLESFIGEILSSDGIFDWCCSFWLSFFQMDKSFVNDQASIFGILIRYPILPKGYLRTWFLILVVMMYW